MRANNAKSLQFSSPDFLSFSFLYKLGSINQSTVFNTINYKYFIQNVFLKCYGWADEAHIFSCSRAECSSLLSNSFVLSCIDHMCIEHLIDTFRLQRCSLLTWRLKFGFWLPLWSKSVQMRAAFSHFKAG